MANSTNPDNIRVVQSKKGALSCPTQPFGKPLKLTLNTPYLVWTTLITNTNYLSGLLTLDYSLKKHKSKYPLVALYTDTFPQEGHQALDSRKIPKKRVKYLLPSVHKDYSNDTRFYDCWSKLTPFSLVEYERVVQLDSDMLVLKNMDELMELELDPPSLEGKGNKVFAASHACVCNPLKKPHYPQDWSVPVLRQAVCATTCPHTSTIGDRTATSFDHSHIDHIIEKNSERNQSTFADRSKLSFWFQIVTNAIDRIPANCAFTTQHADPEAAQKHGASPTAGLAMVNGGLQVVNPSNAIYNAILEHMSTSSAIGDYEFADQSLLSDLFADRWVPLPYIYNALKTLRWKEVHAPIWRDDEVKNIHYILSPKPWDESPQTSTEETHKWWWATNHQRLAEEKSQGIAAGF